MSWPKVKCAHCLPLPASLGLFIFVSAAVALGKSETNVILSCRNSKENCDRTLSRTRTLVHCAITCIHISVCTLCSFPCELCDFMAASRRIAGQDLWSMCQNTRALVALSVAVVTRVAVRVDGTAQSIDHSSALSLFALNQASSGLREKKTKLRSPTLFPIIPSSPLTRRHRVLPDVYPRVYRLQLQQH